MILDASVQQQGLLGESKSQKVMENGKKTFQCLSAVPEKKKSEMIKRTTHPQFETDSDARLEVRAAVALCVAKPDMTNISA